MPLSRPAPRAALHRRAIEMHGYQRDDGLFDIEAHLVDTKTYAFGNFDRGQIQPGEALHGMWLRLTVDEKLVIQTCEAVSDFTPYDICPLVTPNFAVLAGVSVGPGFNRAVKERLGGALGCTHLRELLAQMATVAYQTVAPILCRRAKAARAAAIAAGETPPPSRSLPIGTCYAYAPDSPLVLRHQVQAEE